MTVTDSGVEVIESSSFLEPRRYRIRFACEKCGHEWTRTLKSVPRVDPPCPNKSCADKQEIADLRRQMANLQRMLETGVAPAQIGAKPVVRAVEETAKIVMEDHKLTDLKDNIREGDTMAPKLPPPLQKQADNMFGGKALESAGISSRRLNALAARAIGGAYARRAVAPNQALPNHPMPIKGLGER
jgi:hypothetical protein